MCIYAIWFVNFIPICLRFKCQMQNCDNVMHVFFYDTKKYFCCKNIFVNVLFLYIT